MSEKSNSERIDNNDEAIDALIGVAKKLRRELALCRETMDMKGGFDPAYSADARNAIIDADAVISALRPED
ncbi:MULTISPECIES: hypothetical protein [Marinobacter]|uniref:hypothetical protein n=1 Tax=Marinobacter TaxID=2742 RepID=UPI0005A1920F|nr:MULTISPECIES: hypothetical protein [Marinobacter]